MPDSPSHRRFPGTVQAMIAIVVILVEDRLTRQSLVYGEDGALLWRLDPPTGHDPFDWLRARDPGLFAGRYASPLIESLLAPYDPARVETLLELIPFEHVTQYLYAQAWVEDYALSFLEPDDGGMSPMRLDEPEGVRFSAVSVVSNGVRMTLTWPEGFTNRLDLYQATDLVERDWRRQSGPHATAGTNALVWTNAAGTPGLNFVVAGNHDLDSDGDGFSDAFERLVVKSDPDDPDSRGVHLSGQVVYHGPESGAIHVQAVTGSVSRWAKTWQSVLPAPGRTPTWWPTGRTTGSRPTWTWTATGASPTGNPGAFTTPRRCTPPPTSPAWTS